VTGGDCTDDSHSYIVAISSSGQRLWSEQVGSKYSRAFPVLADTDGDGRLELFAMVNADFQFAG
jgi:hypothetical protein